MLVLKWISRSKKFVVLADIKEGDLCCVNNKWYSKELRTSVSFSSENIDHVMPSNQKHHFGLEIK